MQPDPPALTDSFTSTAELAHYLHVHGLTPRRRSRRLTAADHERIEPPSTVDLRTSTRLPGRPR